MKFALALCCFAVAFVAVACTVCRHHDNVTVVCAGLQCNVKGEEVGCEKEECTCVQAAIGCLTAGDCGALADCHGPQDKHCLDGKCGCYDVGPGGPDGPDGPGGHHH